MSGKRAYAANRRNSQQVDSGAWMAIDGVTGEYIKPDGKGTTHGSLKLEYVDSVWNYVISGNIARTDRFYGCEYKKIIRLEGKDIPYENDFFYAHSGLMRRFLAVEGILCMGGRLECFAHMVQQPATIQVLQEDFAAHILHLSKIYRIDKFSELDKSNSNAD